MRITPTEMLRRGGKWLGAARHWLQWNKRNGSDVTWGSKEVLQPPFTVRDVEEVAAEVAATFYPDENVPKGVIEAAKILTRWHYGSAPGHGEMAPKDCVLVAHSDWIALKKALDDMPKEP